MNGKTASEEGRSRAPGTVFPSITLPAECAAQKKKLALQVKPARGMTFPRLVLLSKHSQSRSFVVNIVTEDVCLPLMISKKYMNTFPE